MPAENIYVGSTNYGLYAMPVPRPPRTRIPLHSGIPRPDNAYSRLNVGQIAAAMPAAGVIPATADQIAILCNGLHNAGQTIMAAAALVFFVRAAVATADTANVIIASTLSGLGQYGHVASGPQLQPGFDCSRVHRAYAGLAEFNGLGQAQLGCEVEECRLQLLLWAISTKLMVNYCLTPETGRSFGPRTRILCGIASQGIGWTHGLSGVLRMIERGAGCRLLAPDDMYRRSSSIWAFPRTAYPAAPGYDDVINAQEGPTYTCATPWAEAVIDPLLHNVYLSRGIPCPPSMAPASSASIAPPQIDIDLGHVFQAPSAEPWQAAPIADEPPPWKEAGGKCADPKGRDRMMAMARQSGRDLTEIAKQFGVAESTVYRACLKHNVKAVSDAGRRPRVETFRVLYLYMQEQNNVSQIARLCGVSVRRVKDIIVAAKSAGFVFADSQDDSEQ